MNEKDAKVCLSCIQTIQEDCKKTISKNIYNDGIIAAMDKIDMLTRIISDVIKEYEK